MPLRALLRGWVDRVRKVLGFPVRAFNQNLFPEVLHHAVLSREPWILSTVLDCPPAEDLVRLLPSRECRVYQMVWWTLEKPGRIRELRRRYEQLRQAEPGLHFTILANTRREKEALDRAGIDALFCNHNAFVDEALFHIQPEIPKLYDAVYDAAFAPYKRHQLGAEIPSLALISYILDDKTAKFRERVRAQLTRATWLNDPTLPGATFLSAEEVCRILNQSRVGLCLSSCEGAMFASVQYLLCGLPIVTTPSRGGREVFFDPEYVITVKPDPKSVARGVRELIGRGLSPQMIRERTLEKMRGFRRDFIRSVQEIHDRAGTGVDFEQVWPSVFIHKLHNYNNLKARSWEVPKSAGISDANSRVCDARSGAGAPN